VWCGVRPEDFRWIAPDAAPNGACLAGSALTVEPLGADTLVTMRAAGAEIVCRVPPRTVRGAGETVRLALDPERLHLFDRAGGLRL
jgi:multiple sugar transport system ATP-binding protein